jgi:hypothetical protein
MMQHLIVRPDGSCSTRRSALMTVPALAAGFLLATQEASADIIIQSSPHRSISNVLFHAGIPRKELSDDPAIPGTLSPGLSSRRPSWGCCDDAGERDDRHGGHIGSCNASGTNDLCPGA